MYLYIYTILYIYIDTYICTIFIHLSIDGHSCFSILAIVTSAAMNKGVHVFF